MGGDPLVGEVPHGLPTSSGLEYGRNGPRMPTGQYMSILTHWGGAGNGGIRLYWGIYCLSPEHGRTIHFNLSYHGLVSVGGA